ncbi:MAG: hypothetical protein ACI4M3_04415 [Acutalibacteraceae bacterium]
MYFIDRIGMGLSQAVQGIVDSNRKYAQLNRLNLVIKAETQTLNEAYIALGKHYYQSMNHEQNEEIDFTELTKTIETAKARLKKAQERYVYIERNGMPEEEYKPKIVPVEAPAPEIIEEEEDYDDGDITICCAEDEKPTEKTADVEVKAESKPVETKSETEI